MTRARNVELRLFGPPLLTVGGAERALPRKRTRALLYYLAVDPVRHARAHLADLVWPELDERKGRRQLSDALSDIRRVLGAEAIGSDADHVWWSIGPVDVPRFSTLLTSAMRVSGAPQIDLLEQALSLVGGELLQGFELEDAEEFDRWLHDRRTQSTLQALEAADRLAKLRLDAGDHDGAIVAARGGIQLDVLHEGLHRTLIEALWLAGDRDAALREYDKLKAALETELGIAPASETRSLRDRIAAGGGTPASRASSRIEAATRTLPTALRSAETQPPLSGRQRELGRLLHGWEQARAGRASLALVTGEPGIGKSRLTIEFAGRVAAEGAPVLAARCPDVADPTPLAALEEALRPAVLSLKPGKLATIGQEWVAWLGRLIPELSVSVPPPAPLPLDEERRRLEEAVVLALRVVSDGQPVLLIIEDLQSAHPVTVALLHRLARRPLPLMLLTTSRDTEPRAQGWLEASRMIEDLEREGRGALIDLAPLSLEETVEMIRSVIGVEGQAMDARLEPLARLADGHPLFAAELARAVSDSPALRELPQTLSAVIRRRLDATPPHERHLLDLAAAVGEPASASLLARAAGRDATDEAFVSALEDAIARRLLREEPHRRGQITITHNLVSTAAYALLSAPRRRALHSRIAAALADEVEMPLAARLDARARHHRLAGEFAQAAQQLVAAGERAASVVALTTASERFAAASELFESQGMLAEAADACERACGARERGSATLPLCSLYDKLVELHKAMGADEQVLAALHRRAAEYLTRFGYCGEIVEQSVRSHITEALRLTDGTRSVDRCRVLAASAFVHGWAGEAEEGLRDALASLELARDESLEWLQAMDAYQCALFGLGRKDEGLAAAQRRLPVAERLGDDWELVDAANMLASAWLSCGEPEAAEEHARRAEEVARAARLDRVARAVRSLRCDALTRLGRAGEAEPLLRAMLEDPDAAEDLAGQRPYRQLLLAKILMERGEPSGALELARSAATAAIFSPQHFLVLYPWADDLLGLLNEAMAAAPEGEAVGSGRRS